MKRDFTNIDDLVDAISLLIDVKPLKLSERKLQINFDNISDTAPYRIVNIGNSCTVNLLDYIKVLEEVLDKVAKKNYLGMQDGDIYKTHSNVNLLVALTGFCPKTTVHEGISKFVKWYKSYY